MLGNLANSWSLLASYLGSVQVNATDVACIQKYIV